jgi:hypothetical protein
MPAHRCSQETGAKKPLSQAAFRAKEYPDGYQPFSDGVEPIKPINAKATTAEGGGGNGAVSRRSGALSRARLRRPCIDTGGNCWLPANTFGNYLEKRRECLMGIILDSFPCNADHVDFAAVKAAGGQT